MNWVDVVLGAILFIGLVKGLANGFVRGLFGLVALVLGIMLAAANYEQVAELALTRLPLGEEGQAIIAFLLVFVISNALKLASLGWLDRLAGGVLGVFISCLFVAVVLLVVVMAGFHTNGGVRRSQVAPAVISVMDGVVALAPEDVREKIEGQYVKLRLEWEKARKEVPEESGDETVAVLGPGSAAGAAGGAALLPAGGGGFAA